MISVKQTFQNENRNRIVYIFSNPYTKFYLLLHKYFELYGMQ